MSVCEHCAPSLCAVYPLLLERERERFFWKYLHFQDCRASSGMYTTSYNLKIRALFSKLARSLLPSWLLTNNGMHFVLLVDDGLYTTTPFRDAHRTGMEQLGVPSPTARKSSGTARWERCEWSRLPLCNNFKNIVFPPLFVGNLYFQYIYTSAPKSYSLKYKNVLRRHKNIACASWNVIEFTGSFVFFMWPWKARCGASPPQDTHTHT